MDGPGLVVLLTGFGPFPGVAHNLSWDMAEALVPAVGAIEGVARAIARPLATVWGEAEASFSKAIAEIAPDIVISLGVSGAAHGIEIEAIGRRQSKALADAAGRLPPTLADAQRPVSRRTRFDVAGLARLLGSGGEGTGEDGNGAGSGGCRISRDAGGYLCNAVYYHGLGVTDRDGQGGPVLFVHIPARLTGGVGGTEPIGVGGDGSGALLADQEVASFEGVRQGLVRLVGLVVAMARDETRRGRRLTVTAGRGPR